jgi:hypothetical protein
LQHSTDDPGIEGGSILPIKLAYACRQLCGSRILILDVLHLRDPRLRVNEISRPVMSSTPSFRLRVDLLDAVSFRVH